MTNEIYYLNDTTEHHVLDSIRVVAPNVRAAADIAVARPFNRGVRRQVCWATRQRIYEQFRLLRNSTFIDWGLYR